ncbi:GtrA family protein [Microbacterium rhizomatis]|uniref:GtrA family protein n=1 Tax=Microbacterium rhizomatis TaxID=1631477 RepID=UPI001478F15B|nr:GtrA family protein [Microbacterium rhizomatis]
MSSPHPRSLGSAGWRFLIIGGLNTAITAVILVGLSYILPGWLAYTITFAIGVAFNTAFASRWVFTRSGSARATAVYALSYVAIYLIGLACVAGIRALEWPEYLNALSILVTAPLGFIAGRLVFRERRREEPPA